MKGLNMNIDNVKVGDKFSTMNKLCKALGFQLQRGAEKKYQINDIERYLKYEKTGKINRNNHKVSNEIIITEIFDEPIAKVDGRENRKGEYTQLFEPLLICVVSGDYTVTKMFKSIFKSKFSALYIQPWKQQERTSKEKFIMTMLRSKFKSNLMSSLKWMQNNNDFSYIKFYRLWNGKKFNEGLDSDTANITDKIEEIDNEVIQKIKEKYNINRITLNHYSEKEKLFNKEIKLQYGYDHCCIMFHISNSVYEYYDREDLEYARAKLRELFADSLSNAILNYSFVMKNGADCFPYKEDELSVELLNEIKG